jgi:hypothetical protein
MGLNFFGVHCYTPGVLLFQFWTHNTEVYYIWLSIMNIHDSSCKSEREAGLM